MTPQKRDRSTTVKALKLLCYTFIPSFIVGCSCKEVGYKTDILCKIDSILQEYKDDAFTFKSEIERFEELESKGLDSSSNEEIHWWDYELGDPLRADIPVHKRNLDELLVKALQCSSQIRVFSDVPLIRRTDVKTAQSAFDPTAFLDAQFERTNRPVGSELESTTKDRLVETEYSVKGGIRKKMTSGATLELAQSLKRKKSNSEFFVPSPQGTAELSLRVTQPILKGSGFQYNTTGIRIAEIDSEIALHEFLRQSEAHLLEIARSYWSLYLARAVYYQKERLMTRTQAVLDEMQGRAQFDINSVQVKRVKSSLAERKADTVRAQSAIRNAQDRLKTLVSDPELSLYSEEEIIPTDAPFYQFTQKFDIIESAGIALKNRSEIEEGFRQLHSALLREKVAKHDLLPSLNAFLEGKLSGLSGNKDYYSNSWNNEFTKGGPGYSAGVSFEYPLGNNAAQAAHSKTRIETRQQINQLTTTIETVLLEVKVAIREVHTAFKDALAKYESLEAAKEDLTAMMARRDVDMGTTKETSAYLEFLLESQERLAKAEESYVQSILAHNLSIFNLERAQGTLLEYKQLKPKKQGDICFEDPCNLPKLTLKPIEKESCKKETPISEDFFPRNS